MEDVVINQNQFNVGQQMLSLGIVLFEIPSNMVLYRVGPGKWLTLQLFLFGTVSTFQAFQNSYGSFIASRFLLGKTESGFIPGGLWTLSTWYTRRETAKRVMFVRSSGLPSSMDNTKKSLSSTLAINLVKLHRNYLPTASCICEVSEVRLAGSGSSSLWDYSQLPVV